MRSLPRMIEKLNRAGWSVYFYPKRTIVVRSGVGRSATTYSRRVKASESLAQALDYLKRRTESEV